MLHWGYYDPDASEVILKDMGKTDPYETTKHESCVLVYVMDQAE